MGNEEGMSFEELLHELKSMRAQMIHHKLLTQEMHRLDAEFFAVQRLDRAKLLPTIELTNANVGDTERG